MTVIWRWIVGAIVGFVGLIVAYFKGKKAGVDIQVSKENAAKVEAHVNVDRLEQSTSVKLEQIEVEKKAKLEALQRQSKERQAKPVEDTDLDRIVKESNAAADIERNS